VGRDEQGVPGRAGEQYIDIDIDIDRWTDRQIDRYIEKKTPSLSLRRSKRCGKR